MRHIVSFSRRESLECWQKLLLPKKYREIQNDGTLLDRICIKSKVNRYDLGRFPKKFARLIVLCCDVPNYTLTYVIVKACHFHSLFVVDL